MADEPTTRKVQLTVPVADSTVTEWLDLQHSPSESLRRLIRESVAREGFVDVANRPVRPPANPVYVAETYPDEAIDEDDDFVPAASAPAKTAPKAQPEKTEPAKKAEPKKPAKAEEPAPARATKTRSTRAAEAPSEASAAPTIDDLLGL